MDSLFDSKPIEIAGKSAFAIGLFGGILNLITRMEILQTPIVILSGVLGLIFMFLKIAMIYLQYHDKIQEMKKEGKEIPKFFSWLSRKNNTKK